MSTHLPLDYPFGEFDRLEPHPKWAELRRDQPLARVRLPYGGEAWLVTAYEDVRTVLSDPRFSRAAAVGKDVPRTRKTVTAHTSILDMDPPDHTRLRRLLVKAFSVRQVTRLLPLVQQAVDDLLDRMADAGPPADLMDALAWPLPVLRTCALLGVPAGDRERFRALTDVSLAVTEHDDGEIQAAKSALRDYFADLIAERRRRPTDDLLSALITARDADDRLTEDELVSINVTLLEAAYETTASQIGNFVYTLFAWPDQLARLRADPGLTRSAVDELMRFTPLVAYTPQFPRIATEDVELGGGTVRAGETVYFEAAAANRDGTVYDRPDELDIGRIAEPHTGFGHGPHYCVGAQMAKQELQITLATLLRRFPDLALVDIDAVPWRHGRIVRSPLRLPVTWSEVVA